MAACGPSPTEKDVVGSGGMLNTGGSVPDATGKIAATGGSAASSGGAWSAGGMASGGAAPASGGASGGTEPGSGGVDSGSGGMATGSGGEAAGAGGSDATGGAEGSGGAASGEPVMHVFMLLGQSNMAGVATREAGDTNNDDRMMVFGGCGHPAMMWSVATQPPLNECPGEKGWNPSDSVGPGMWFAKTLLEKLPPGDTIGLVGTAESGQSINTFISGGLYHNMVISKASGASMQGNARLAGMIFHQGESDSGQQDWPGKVVQLYNEVKEAFGADYDVPFILGELPASGCCGGHNPLIHQAADMLPDGAWVSQEGTAILDQYHWDHPSVVTMGKRYGDQMIEMLGW